jgi:hypothetical protein
MKAIFDESEELKWRSQRSRQQKFPIEKPLVKIAPVPVNGFDVAE